MAFIAQQQAMVLRFALLCSVILVVLAASFGNLQQSAYAEPLVVACDTNALLEAVAAATNSPEANTLQLTDACIYQFDVEYISTENGLNGLPVVTAAGGPLIIEGNGATFERGRTSEGEFRFFEVASGADLTLQDLTLAHGHAGPAEGGAILNFGTLTLANVVLRDNEAGYSWEAERNGGALSNYGTASIRQSALINNIATAHGGAIAHASGSLVIENATISRNEAIGYESYGGGIYAVEGTITLNNVTIADNILSGEISAGGGIYGSSDRALFTINNSIITGHTGFFRPNCSIEALSPESGTNLEGPGGSCPGFSEANPGLLLDSSGLFYTLERTSPARNAGDVATCAPTDQRGVARASDGACDLGAIEFDDVLVVTNANDSGPGSLRQAILEANATPEHETIRFDLPGTGVQTIVLASDLPRITAPIILDGLSQPGASCATWPPTLAIEVSGAGGASFGLILDAAASGSTVRGMVINRFAADGIFAEGGNHVFACNFIGTDATGSLDRGNGQIGIFLNGSDNNLIGGALASQRNLIAGNDFEQIRVAAASNNVIQGNYLGTNAAGTASLGANGVAMLVTGSNNLIGGTTGVTPGGACTGACNVIGGYTAYGIDVAAPSGANNRIEGNHIGVNVTGNAVVNTFGSGNLGIWLNGGANNNTIGGLANGAGNVIAGHGEQAILIEGATTNANRIFGNRIYNNGSSVVLRNGANNDQRAPTLTTAIPDFPVAGKANIQGWLLTGTGNMTYTVQLFGGEFCAAGGNAEARTLLDTFEVVTDEDGTVPMTRTLAVGIGSFVTATATDSAGNSSALATCAPVGPDNTVWYQALPLGRANPTASQQLALAEQVRWYYVEVEPLSRLVVNLTNLPAGYDVALFNDLNARAEEILAAATNDLTTTLALAQTQIDYTALEASNFITNTLAPELYSPEAFTSLAFAPGAFQPNLLAEAVVSPFKASPFKASPFKASPFKASPFKASPFKASPFKASPFKASDLASIVVDSGLLAYTDIEGTLPRTLALNTFNERGRIYIAVYGRNGAYDPVQPFTLTAATNESSCVNVVPPAVDTNGLPAQAGAYQTLVLTDLSRLPGSASELTQLQTLLGTFMARPEIGGVLVDVGLDARIAAAHATADANISCPEAKNLVAGEIKALIERYRALNPSLRYIVLIGGDDVIPFFRYPDQALLGNESEFKPPVDNDSSSEAALRLGYILGQDEYGARFTVSFRTTRLAIPDLPVGRLVETANEAMTMLNRYLATNGVVVPTSSFVSGYDFHFESASAIAESLSLGTNQAAATLLSPSTDSYQLPGTWTADDLRSALSNGDYDLLYLAGHFSDGALKAADYATVLRTADLADLGASRLAGALVVSPGCHSGYNTPDGAAIAGATDQPDWAQFFARRGTTLVGGTGYQYGDTQFTEFAEKLYTNFFDQLRIDRDPTSPLGDEVAVGEALVLAKQRYLLDAAVIRGIDKKTLTISAIFGLPMTRINMPGERLGPEALPPLPDSFTPIGPPDELYRVQVAEVTVRPDLTVETLDVTTLGSGATVQATYVRGATPDDVIARPGEPVLPVVQYRVGQEGQQLRGAILLRSSYSEAYDVLPLTGAPATELRGVHITFPTEAFYPEQWWTINRIGEVIGITGGERTRLQLTPAQFLANPDQIEGTLRYYDGAADFRLFYSDQTAVDANGFNPALAGAPAIPVVTFSRNGDRVDFEVSANGGGVPMREVWVTFTAARGPLAGQWQSMQLGPSEADPSGWEGSYLLADGTEGFAFFVQAVNAAGLTAMNTNLGLYFQAGGFVNGTVIEPPPPPVPTTPANALATNLSLETPEGATFGQPATFIARLSANGAVNLADQPISLSIGAQTVTVPTNSAGEATFTLVMFSTGQQVVGATFGGSLVLQPARIEASLDVAKQQPALTAGVEPGDPSRITATLTDSNGGIRGARLYLSVGDQVITGLTGPTGVANFALPPLAPGEYPFAVTYLLVPGPTGLLTENEARYLPATATGSLTIQGNPGLDTTILSSPSGTISDSVATIDFAGSGTGDLRFECRLSYQGEPANFAPCVSPIRYQGLANGSYLFDVRAVTSDGLVDETPAQQTWIVNQNLYRARQQGARVWIERNTQAAGLGDYDGAEKDGWALVGRTNGARDNGELCGFYVEDGIPYAIIFKQARNKADRCILVTPVSLAPVKKGQTRFVKLLADPVPCSAATGSQMLP
ncbi:choice-of-anchor Q domain-containing protein [Candidatus Chloroploca sp. Khr17]|uniref:choice-of-anchor Q domain-containing protein n=1 Tax=Candidatus Chloroploca sp. Khr17 TaxID=2496869 RepID=UPI0013EC4868|nr:choice-of-anchor Q domain-containing protein [Candidatus Chloroploca sp. Khr17]